MTSRILMVGCGWRSKFYLKAIENFKEYGDAFSKNALEICGILMHSEQRAKEVMEETGIYATADFEEAVSLSPDFVLLCVPKAAVKEQLIRFMKAGLPILCETPPALDVDSLNEIWQSSCRYNGRVQVAEQYFMQPYYASVLKIIQDGVLGEVVNVNMSAIHEYHAISIFRKFLGIGFENCSISGKRYQFPVTKTRNRQGWHQSGEILYPPRTRGEFVFENGKTAFYDFDKEQYFSPIRSRSWNIQGVRGEIRNMSVCYLDEEHRPITELFHREDDGVYNIDGWSHMHISFKGKRVYENPFPGMRVNDDELAIADMLMRMKRYVETGEEFYSLRDGLQDAYLDVCLEKAVISGNTVVTTPQSWV